MLSPPARDGSQASGDNAFDGDLQFNAVPVVYPLLIAASLGLLLWFVPATFTPRKSVRRRSRR